MKSGNPIHFARFVAGAAASLVLASSTMPALAIIGEPETIIYGKILNRVNPNAEQLVIEGSLLWTIQKPDGVSIQLLGEVAEMAGGEYSYVLRVPHQAVALGESPSAQTVPLGTSESTGYHTGITLNGVPAEILPPATSGFDLDQLLRATAIRVDLEVLLDGLDTDGDGIPDWWEDQYGLDKQDAADALADSNGNGLSNLAEFLAGNDPNRDSTRPLLLTREVIAYADSTSIVPLEVADSDSGPGQLEFTLYTVPDGGNLLLRNSETLPSKTDQVLSVGDSFTMADVVSGRLVFEHGATTGSDTFEVGVRDEDPLHEESRGEVSVLMFDSSPEDLAMTSSEKVRFECHRLTRDLGHLVADFGSTSGPHLLSAPTAGLSDAEYATHVADYGAESPHIFLGGPGDDVLTGGATDDFLLGAGGSDSLTGGPGADSFLYLEASDDIDVILDFDPEEGDVIDISAVLGGSSTLLTDYVRISRSGTDALLEVSASGAATGFTDLVVRLEGSSLQAGDLPSLYYAGNLLTGAVGLPPRLGVAALRSASENGPADGSFLITREGELGQNLTVLLQLTGNATNGVDYQFVQETLLLPAGESSIELGISPYVDSNVEFDEIVFLSLSASPDYLLASGSSAQISIEDLKPQLSLEVLEGVASVDEGVPGAILMRRGGLTTSEVFVQFTLDGSAVNGVDYDYVSPFLSLSPGQSTKLIQFSPKPTTDFGGSEGKTIRMTLTPDVAYALPVPMASLRIVPRRLTYSAWLAEHGLTDGPVDGMPLVMRYAFAIDPLLPQDPLALPRMPRAETADGYLTIRFQRKPGITDHRYEVEYTNDLVNWNTGPDFVEEITPEVAPDDAEAAVYRATRPMSEVDRAAMRVRIVPGSPNN